MSIASDEETNFARVSQIIIELYPQALRNVLHSIVDPAKLSPPVKLKGNSSKCLSADQRTIVHDLPYDGNYNRCDTSLLYILYRGLPGVNQKPTKGWGKLPNNPSHVLLGDDVERIREFRNRMFGHVQSAVLTNQDYLDFINDARNILARFDTNHGGTYPPDPSAGSYLGKLNMIEKKIMDPKAYNEFRNELQILKANETALETRVSNLENETARIDASYLILSSDVQQQQIKDQESISNLEGNLAAVEERHDELSKDYKSTAKTVSTIEQKQLEDEETVSTIKQKQLEDEEIVSTIEKKQLEDEETVSMIKQKQLEDEETVSTIKQKQLEGEETVSTIQKKQLEDEETVSRIEQRQLEDEESISTLQVNQDRCNDFISVIQSEQVKDKIKITHIQRNLETINEKLESNAATLTQSEQIEQNTEVCNSSFVDDSTNHYHCIAGTSWYTWAHHSTNQNPTKLLNNVQKSRYIPDKVSYQLYENGDTRLYSAEELESKFLEKFRTVFSTDMERQPWLFTNLHEDCVEDKDFYDFCKNVEKFGMNEKHSFLFVDYRYEDNLFQMEVDVERLKKDLVVGEEDSKYRVLLYLGEKKMIFNIQFVHSRSEDDNETRRNKIIDAIQKGQNDLKLFSALHLDLLANSDFCFTCLVAVNGVSKEEFNQLIICNDCTENLALLADDLKDEETLTKKLNKLVFERDRRLECNSHALNSNELHERLFSKIYASMCVKDVYLPTISVNNQNTLTRIYLNNDQRRFLHFTYKYVILKGGYGSGKSILAQEKFKERINNAGPSDHLYYIVFSDDTLYTSVLRSSIQCSLPKRINKEHIHILNFDEYRTKYMHLGASLLMALEDIQTRHMTDSCQVSVVIDELDGSIVTKDVASSIKAIVENFHYVLFVIQSMEVSRTKVEKAGLLKSTRTCLDGHQFDYTDMKVITLHMIMRNSTRINELSRISVKVLECHTNRYYERDASKNNDRISVSRTELSSTSGDTNNLNTQNDAKPIQTSKEETVFEMGSLDLSDPDIPPIKKKTPILTFDHCAKVMSSHSQSYTGILYESNFQFPGDWTNGHSIEGCIPRLIYPFLYDTIDFTTVNHDFNKLRMFFALKHLVQVEHRVGELAIIVFDSIDAKLMFEVLITLRVPVIVHAPALLMTSNQTLDTLRNSLKTHILITDHIGARGMEFKQLLVVFNPNEILLQQYLIEAFTRAIFELTFLLVYKKVRKLKEDSMWEKKSVCNKLIKEWVRQKLVHKYNVVICQTHMVEDFTAGLYCTNGDVTYAIHPWHKDFYGCSDISQIKEPHIDANVVLKQFNSHVRTLSGRNAIKVLILGATSSGKTTFLRQMRIMHGRDYDHEALTSFKPIIYSNILKGMKVLVDARSKLRIEWGDPACVKCGENLLNLQYEQVTTELFLEHVGNVKKLWRDRGIQEAYKRRNEFQLGDSTEYFFNKLDDIGEKDYVPSKQDMLHSRTATKGIHEYEVEIKGIPFVMVDVGGARQQRTKWFQAFDNVTAILFMVSSSAYDEVIMEDRRTNCLIESCMIFEQIVNRANVPIILFLNKTDLLEQKLQSKHNSIQDFFLQFQGDPYNMKDVQKFILKMFDSRRHNRSTALFHHFTTAIGTNNINFVFHAVKDIILQDNLKSQMVH